MQTRVDDKYTFIMYIRAFFRFQWPVLYSRCIAADWVRGGYGQNIEGHLTPNLHSPTSLICRQRHAI